MCFSALTESVDGFYLLLMNFDKLYRRIIKTKHSQVEEKRERERDIYKAAVQFETKHLKSTLKNFHYLNSSVLNV